MINARLPCPTFVLYIVTLSVSLTDPEQKHFNDVAIILSTIFLKDNTESTIAMSTEDVVQSVDVR